MRTPVLALALALSACATPDSADRFALDDANDKALLGGTDAAGPDFNFQVG